MPSKNFIAKTESKEDLKNTLRDRAFSILDEVNQEFHQSAIAITLKRADELGLTQSKVAGLPYIPIGGEIPVGTENRQLSLFAQINCKELPENDLYPKEGILQFWFLDNFDMGIDYDDLTNQDNFRVIYYETIGEHYSKENLTQMLHPYQEDNPLFKNAQYEMRFKVIESYLNDNSGKFEEEFCSRWNSRYEPKIEYIYELKNIFRDLVEEIWDKMDTEEPVHRIGGYPTFIQDDPRYGVYENFETLLLQIDSQFNDEKKEWEILFGDAGICNFFIEPERLKALDFSRVMFTMDCH